MEYFNTVCMVLDYAVVLVYIGYLDRYNGDIEL